MFLIDYVFIPIFEILRKIYGKLKVDKRKSKKKTKIINRQKSRNLSTVKVYFVNYAFCRLTDEQNIYKIDSHWPYESSQQIFLSEITAEILTFF